MQFAQAAILQNCTFTLFSSLRHLQQRYETRDEVLFQSYPYISRIKLDPCF